jgi:hypothetical protein
VNQTARLREIRALVHANNTSSLSDNLIVAQAYMESRFNPNASAQGSSAKGLMQLLRAPIRELYRQENLKLPRHDRRTDSQIFRDADTYHDGNALLDEATNINIATKYLAILIGNRQHMADPVAEAYKDYRGIRNGIYYAKIKAAADRLENDPDNMQILLDMVH